MANKQKLKKRSSYGPSNTKVKEEKSAKKRKSKNIFGGSKEKKPRKKRHILLILFLIVMIMVSLSGLSFAVYIMVSAPEFKVEKLYKSSSSIIYDAEGNVIANLSREKRENVTYDELPDVLVDAIVATEDSKFFQHSGVDLLRFGKAVLGQLLGHSDAGGASTLTMQIIKNTYSDKASHGVKGIIRKFTDIYMAVFKLEKTYTKQEIMEFYVNQAAMGMQYYGVAQAAETYFGKNIGELNLSEAATIAGLFQAPNAYYPFSYPEKAEARRNIVLNLMVRHGYITQEEADAAKAIKMSDLLKNTANTTKKTYEYQDFIDTVVAEVIRDTKDDPYLTSMSIKTTMIKDKQDAINKVYSGETFNWKDDEIQAGIAVTNVHDGAVVAVGANRNRTGVKLYNYATDIKRHPGSTIKPIMDYGPAIEYRGWGTGTMVVDDYYTYSNGQSLHNFDGGYKGIMTVKTALAQSRNVPALQAFQATSQQEKYEFVTNLRITPEVHNDEIYESSSIGAFNGVSPLELSAAYGAFARGGIYIEPYTYTEIVYNDTNMTVVKTPVKERVMSEETAFMINMILKYAVTSGNVSCVSVSGTDIAGKTGTSSVDSNQARQYGINPSIAIGDAWQVAYSPDYAIATWYGYDEQITKEHYLKNSEGWAGRKGITNALVPRIMDKNSRWEQPSGVVAVDIELGSSPTMLASSYTPDSQRSTEYFRKGTEPTEVSTRFSQLSNVSNLTYTNIGNQIQLSWTPISTPEAINETYLQNYFSEGYGTFATKYYQNRLNYNNEYIGTVLYEIFIKNSDGSLTSLGTTSANNFTVNLYNATSATYVVKSRYSIFSLNASNGTEINVKINSVIQLPGDDDDENKKDDDQDEEKRDDEEQDKNGE